MTIAQSRGNPVAASTIPVNLTPELFRLIDRALERQSEWSKISRDHADNHQGDYRHRKILHSAFDVYQTASHKVRVAFARAQGWKITKAPFSLSKLANRKAGSSLL